MDVLYTADIPKSFKYAVFSNDYVTLYDQPIGYNNNLPFYRIYFSPHGFYYSQGTQTFGGYNTTYFTEIEVSDKWYYREDAGTILCFLIAWTVATLWFINLFTSIFKKGGVLGGLF